LLQESLPKRGNAGFWPALRHEIRAACCSSYDGTASTTPKELNCLFYLHYYLFSQLSDDIVFISSAHMSELHRFGFLGAPCELFREHLQQARSFDKKKQKQAPKAFKDL
jgi:hypothetical protein